MKSFGLMAVALFVGGCSRSQKLCVEASLTEPLNREHIEYTVVNSSKKPLIIQAGVWGRGHDVKLESYIVLQPGEEQKWKPYLSARKNLLAQNALNEDLLKLRQPLPEYGFHLYVFENGGAGEYLGNVRGWGGTKDYPMKDSKDRLEIGPQKVATKELPKVEKGAKSPRKVIISKLADKSTGEMSGTQTLTTGIDHDKHIRDLVYCTFAYENGRLPSPSEMARFERISERIDEMERTGDFVLVCSVMLNGNRDYIMYTAFGKELAARLRAELAPFQPEIEVQSDPEWEQYRDLVDTVRDN